MRVNVYAEEMTDRVEIISKRIDGHTFTGLRFYLELPATVQGHQYQGPFIHRPGDDDSSAVTFWGKRDLRKVFRKALTMLDAHYSTLIPRKLRSTAMPGPVSDSQPGPGPDCPYVPSWCYANNDPPMCSCGHHHGYHNDAGACLQAHKRGCSGYDGELVEGY